MMTMRCLTFALATFALCASAHAAGERERQGGELRVVIQQQQVATTRAPAPRELTSEQRAELRRQLIEAQKTRKP